MKQVVVGLDTGSASVKGVLINGSTEVVGSLVIDTPIFSVTAAEAALDKVLTSAAESSREVKAVIATGYGRSALQSADEVFSEITCHARGASFLLPGVRTVIDIGGQDAKVISLRDDGVVAKFTMNDRCAAGTGRFLEVLARALELGLNEMGELSLESSDPVPLSGVCTVFIETEVISKLVDGRSKADIVSGVHVAMARRLAGLIGSIPVVEPLIMTGGVSLNTGLVRELERVLGVRVHVHNQGQLAGAIGAALLGLKHLEPRHRDTSVGA